MDQEEAQEALTWGATMEMTAAGAEEATTGAATEAAEGTVGASEGAGVVGTEVALAPERWTPGVSTDRIAGRGRIRLPRVSGTATLLYPVLPSSFCNLIPDPQIFVLDCNCNYISGSH